MKHELSKEKIQWLHDACEEAAATGIKLTMNPNELLMFTSALLAAHEQEPVAKVVSKFGDPEAFGERELAVLVDIQKLPYNTPFYRHPAPSIPAAVPEEATPGSIEIMASIYAPRGVTYQWDVDECNAAADSWNACRAAMLQAEPVSQPYKLPDGYVLVPVDATRAMIDAASRAEEDGYDAMHKAMIAAAPKGV